MDTQQSAHHIRHMLGKIGDELAEQITQDLIGLTDLIGKCERVPQLDESIGSFASISYRLCDVFKITADVGFRIKQFIEATQHFGPAGMYAEQLAADMAELGNVAEKLKHLYDSNLTFLSHDLSTLMHHPEVMQAAGVVETLKLVRDQLLELESRIDYLTEDAKNLRDCEIPAQISVVKKKRDRATEALQAMLENCMTMANKMRNEEIREPVEGPLTHPKCGDDGKPCIIKQPSQPTSSSTWLDSHSAAVFIPGGKSPSLLNGVPVSPWVNQPTSAQEWNTLDLLMPSLDEPPLPKSSLPMASGVVTIEPDGRIWMVSPTNKFGGYETTFPKGKLDHGTLTLQANAVKECVEESGLKVRITGYLGDFKRTTSITRLYLAERVGGDPKDMGWESQAVKLVPHTEWATHLQNPSDKPVLAAIKKHFGLGS